MRNSENEHELPSRRTALALGAWSVPVVAAAVAAPAAAASNAGSVYYVYQSYAGWNETHLVLEAFIYLRAGDVPQSGIQVNWSMIETGQVFTATSTANGFARVDAIPSTVVGTPVNCEITADDARKVIQVQGTRPV
jgi:hypothetical protein